jgi:hypothetical protein
MPRDNAAAQPDGTGSPDDPFAPLWRLRFEQPSGRIRSLREARAALRVPLSDAPEILQAWGRPPDFQLVAFPVSDPEQPDLVAEFAALRVLRQRGRELAPAHRNSHLSIKAKSNSLWIVYGSIVTNAAGTHVIENLSIGPAFSGQLNRPSDELAHGITSALLRTLSPARLLSETIERLRRDHHQLRRLESEAETSVMPAAERQAFAKLEAGRPANSSVSEEQIKAIAERYLTLVHLGETRPLPRLAAEFGTTREQMRDRVHKARNDYYLARTTPGRVSATPGPRLKNWTPPSTILTGAMAAEWRDYGSRVLLTMPPEIEATYAPMACPNPRPPTANPVIYLDNKREEEASAKNLMDESN